MHIAIVPPSTLWAQEKFAWYTNKRLFREPFAHASAMELRARLFVVPMAALFPRHHALGFGVAALLLVLAGAVVTKIDAATERVYVEEFSSVPAALASGWSASWDSAAGDVRLRRAVDNGNVWVTAAAFDGRRVSGVAYTPEYAASRTAFIAASDGVYRTTDGGSTWLRMLATGSEAVAVAVSPTFSGDGIAFAMTNGSGLWRTIDGGVTWLQVDGSVNGFGIAFSPAYATDRTVFVAAFDRVLRSQDSGVSWFDISSGVSDAVRVNGDIRAVAVDPAYQTNHTVFLSTLRDGLYRSVDAGTTWTLRNPAGISVPYATALAASSTGRVAALFLDGVYETTDGGAGWSIAYRSEDASAIAYGPGGQLLVGRSGGVARVEGGTATALALGWVGSAPSAFGIAPTYPAHGSVIAGRADGANVLMSGLASPGIALTANPVDDTPHRILTATLTPTATVPAGAAITYEVSAADGAARWEGPVTPGTVWTFTVTGSSLRWRATLISTNGEADPRLTALRIAYTVDDTIGAPTIATPVPAATSIRWPFANSGGAASGFAIRDADGKELARTDDPAATFVEERALAPDTEYCGRRVVALSGTKISPVSDSYPCAVTLAVVPGAATASDVTRSSAVIAFGAGSGNADDIRYAIKDKQSGRYVAADGLFGTPDAVWRTFAEWERGRVLVIGLEPDHTYAFCAEARNHVGVPSACSATTIVSTTVGSDRGDASAQVQTTLASPDVRTDDRIPVVVRVAHAGTGIVRNLVVSIPIPAGAVPMPGTLVVNGVRASDAGDADAADVGATAPGVATFRLATLGIGATAVFGIDFRTTAAAGASLTVAPTMAYVPLADVAPRTVALAPLTFSVIGPLAPPPDTAPPQQPVPPQEAPPAEPVGAPLTVTPQPTPPPQQPGAPPVVPIPDVAAPGTSAAPGTASPAPGVTRANAATMFALLAPVDGAVLPAGDLVIRGAASSDASVTVSLDDRTHWNLTAAADQSFSLTIRNVSEGSHRISVTTSGQSTAAQVRMVSPPLRDLTLTAPIAGSATNAQTVVVSGRGPSETMVRIALDGTPIASVETDALGGFTALLPGIVAEGAHEVRGDAVVAGGLTLTAAAPFVVDRTPPGTPEVREVRTTKQGIAASRADAFDVLIQLAGIIPAASAGDVDAILITIGGESATFTHRVTSVAWEFRTTLALPPGGSTIRVAARDSAGNVSPLPQVLPFAIAPAACADGMDNDGDALLDYPADPDCASAFDRTEETEGIAARTATVVAEATTATAKAVVSATQTTAKATAKAAEKTAVAVQERVLDNPAVETTTERVVAPAVVVAVATNTATAVHGFQLLAYAQYLVGFLLSPSRLFSRRKRTAWGTVYGALSKRPVDLATVRLLDVATGRVVATEVTDHLGRYNFAVKQAGSYRLDVRHPQYAYPSTRLAGRREDGDFLDCTYGEPFAVPEGGGFVIKSIPLDAKAERTMTLDKHVLRNHYGRIISGAVSDVGLVLSIASFAISPRPLIGAVLGINLLFYVLFRRLAIRARAVKSWGAIRDVVSKHPLHLAVVRLFDIEFGKLLETAATDRYGRYQFLAGKSVYYVTAQKGGYDPARSSTLDMRKREGIVGVDLALHPSVHTGALRDAGTTAPQDMTVSPGIAEAPAAAVSREEP
ncbi:MAG: hypothetical protein Q7T01_01425 [bacterium]|nr:hypothetical protein [bacterium]